MQCNAVSRAIMRISYRRSTMSWSNGPSLIYRDAGDARCSWPYGFQSVTKRQPTVAAAWNLSTINACFVESALQRLCKHLQMVWNHCKLMLTLERLLSVADKASNTTSHLPFAV